MLAGISGLIGCLIMRHHLIVEAERAEHARMREARSLVELTPGFVDDDEARRRRTFIYAIPSALGIAVLAGVRALRHPVHAIRHASRGRHVAGGIAAAVAAGTVAGAALILAQPPPHGRRLLQPCSGCTQTTGAVTPTATSTASPTGSPNASRQPTTGAAIPVYAPPSTRPSRAQSTRPAAPRRSTMPTPPATHPTDGSPTTSPTAPVVTTQPCLVELAAVGIDVCVKV